VIFIKTRNLNKFVALINFEILLGKKLKQGVLSRQRKALKYPIGVF
jgi:hypothetical protein